jgi:hypothetical protein
MWRAFRGARKILKEEAVTFKAIDCLDWCEVGAWISRLNLLLHEISRAKIILII